MAKIECPFCKKVQNQEPEVRWRYRKTIEVKRFKCACGRFFNYFKSTKNEWTIPKRK